MRTKGMWRAGGNLSRDRAIVLSAAGARTQFAELSMMARDFYSGTEAPPAGLRRSASSGDDLARPCVWILNHYANIPEHAAPTRHHDLAKRLVGRGFAVTIVASSFHRLPD